MVRLKTYTAEIDGLHEWIVAAPNQQAALDGFGVNQNLFAQGAAGVSKDSEAIKAAEAKPRILLRRMKGSTGPFEEADSGTDWSSALEASAVKTPKNKRPSRRALDEAETILKAFDREGRSEIAELETQVTALTRRLDQAKAAFDQQRGELQTKVQKARQDYESKGG